jgi:predicted small secreted protein
VGRESLRLEATDMKKIILAIAFLLAACGPAAAADLLLYDGSVLMKDLIRGKTDPVVHVVWRAEPYLDTIGWSRSGSLTVIGLPGPNGERPAFNCPSGGSGATVRALKGMVNHLRLEHLEIARCNDGVVGVSQPDTGAWWYLELIDLWVHHNGDNGVQTGGGDEAGQWSKDVLVVKGGHYHHQGSVLSHNFYVGHIWSATVEGVYSHDAGGGSSLKIASRYYEVRNNRLATTELEFVPADYRDASGLVLDIVSCSSGVVAGNEILVYHQGKTDLRRYKLSRSGIAYRNRNSDIGCDEPPYGDYAWWNEKKNGGLPPDPSLGLIQLVNPRGTLQRYWTLSHRTDPEFWNPAYWAAARAAGIWQDGAPWQEVVVNPYLYLHFVSGNRIVNVTHPDDPFAGRGTIGIGGASTAPRAAEYNDGPAWLERPDGWFERAVVVAACNTYEGRLIPSSVGGHNWLMRVPGVAEYDNPVHEIETACPDLPEWFRR